MFLFDARPVSDQVQHGIARYAYELAKGYLQNHSVFKKTTPAGGPSVVFLLAADSVLWQEWAGFTGRPPTADSQPPTADSRPFTAVYPHIHFHRMQHPWASLKGQWELTKTLDLYRPKIAHIPHFMMPFWYGKETVLIPTLHDVTHLVMAEEFSAKQRLFYKWFVKPCVQKAPLVFTVSEFSKKEIHRVLQVPLNQIVVTYNGCPSVPTVPVAANGCSFVTEPSPFVLLLGQTKAYKNLDRALQALVLATTRVSHPFSTVIVGMDSATWKRRYSQRFANLKHVQTLGVVNDQTLAHLYATCSVFVYVSLYEGFGLPPLEALQAGARVLTSQGTVMEEVLGAGDGQQLCYVNPTDTEAIAQEITRLLAHSFAPRAWPFPRAYCWDTTVQQTLQAFCRLDHMGFVAF